MSKELIDPIEFFKIDKISDDVFAIGPNVILKFNVSLSKFSNGKRYHFHKEYEYPTKVSTDQESLVTIKRSFDYYLSIENMTKDINGNKMFIRIGPQEYFLVLKGLEAAASWFTDTKYSKLFAMDRGNLIITSPSPEYSISSLPMGKSMKIVPIIIDRGVSNADKEPGIRIIFGDSGSFIDMTLDKLMGLYYTISSIRMYEAALALVNYVQRPEFGTGRIVMDSPKSIPAPEMTEKSGAIGVIGRKVTPAGTKNNISDLEG